VICPVEVVAEVVPLCSEKEAPTTAGFSLQVQTYRNNYTCKENLAGG
jgi:hypothetical protein